MFQICFLPDDCLRLILEQCSLQQLLRLRSVCTRWRALIERMCRNRRSLRVFESPKDIEEYLTMRYYFLPNRNFRWLNFAQGDNILVVGPSPAMLDSLATLFPNLQTLLILYSQSFVTLSAAKYPSTLTSLTLVAKMRSGAIPSKIWSWVNSMQSLRSLSLFGMFDYKIPDLMVLSQLELFSLTGYSGDIVPILSQLGSSLKHLYLDRLSFPLERLNALFSAVKPIVAQSVTHLSIGSLNTGMLSHKGYIEKIKLFMRFFCEHFQRLSYLHVRFALQIPLGELISELSRLQRLTELRLAQIGSSNPKEAPNMQQFHRLDSVRILCLESTTYNAAYDPFWRKWIPEIFPNLEKFKIEPETRSTHDGDVNILSNRLSYLRVQ